MQLPVFRNNRFAKACHKISSIFDHALYRFLIKPILFIIPVSLLFFIVSDSGLFNSAIGFLPQNIKSFLVDSHLLIVATIFILLQIGKSLEDLIRHYGKPNSELSRDDLHSILTCIDEVVSGKLKRFLTATKAALRDGWDPAQIFAEITQPSQQIALQVKALHGFFEYFTKIQVSFRVGLMRIKDGRPVDWASFHPNEHPPKASLGALASPTSTIMSALEAGETVIVSDVDAELKKNKNERRFVAAGSKGELNASILAKPIYCPNTKEPIYVLSVLAKQKNCLEAKNKDLYDWIIDNFLSRILIEHHLLILKEGVKQ